MKLVRRGKEKSGLLALVSKALAPFWPMQRLQSELDRQMENSFRWCLAFNVTQLDACRPALDFHRIDAHSKTESRPVDQWLGFPSNMEKEGYDSMRSMRKSIR